MSYAKDVLITADRATVFAAVSDPSTWPEWMRSVASAKPSGGSADAGPDVAAGDTFSVRTKWALPDAWTVVELVPQERASFRGGFSPDQVVMTYTLTEAGEGTQVRCEIEPEGIIPRAGAAMFRSSHERELEQELTGLKEYCEAR